MSGKKSKQAVPAKELGVRMKMGVKDRLMVVQLLPKEGNLIALRLIKDITQKTELTQEEMKQIEMKPTQTGGVLWDDKKEKKFGKRLIKLSSAEIGYMKDQVKKLDEKEKISRDAFELAERIHNIKIGEKEEGEEKGKEGGNGNP